MSKTDRTTAVTVFHAMRKPKLQGTSSRAFREYYRKLDEWERAQSLREINAEGREARARAKAIDLTKDPKAVARMERQRTMKPRQR